ncbi:hypothetical protein JK202_05110 [Gluconobacter sp. Dm-62]|uniref:hypothetical protein n=1 Tax=Gluconobacter sp. Dm-62 TaxID=2799804 RepID=UPI001B8BF736|nr:hypothetical protein [Gluconobacter sp. Dm-62]MBS1102398.1 hypothetical protein [Gluconobacter sp. Dm-62]
MPRPTLPATALLAPLLIMGGCASKASLSPGFEKTLSHNQQGHPFSGARNSIAFQGEPDLSTAHPANLAGTLHYCLQNMTLKDAGGVPPVAAVTDDMAYNAGKQGILQALSRRTGEREQYALPSMPKPLRQTVCTSVASRLRQPV